jgi:ankyrin repeat protein
MAIPSSVFIDSQGCWFLSIESTLWIFTEMLLSEDSRLDVDFRYQLNRTALGRCCLKAKDSLQDSEGHFNCVRLLLEHGANPNLVDFMKCSALHDAAEAVKPFNNAR